MNGDDRGGASVELTLLALPLVVLVVFVVFAGRLGLAVLDVRQAAAAAARAASVTGDAETARAAAHATVDANLSAAGVECTAAGVSVTAPMTPGSRVEVSVTCPVALADLAVPGMPGAATVTADAAEPVDEYRPDR